MELRIYYNDEIQIFVFTAKHADCRALFTFCKLFHVFVAVVFLVNCLSVV